MSQPDPFPRPEPLPPDLQSALTRAQVRLGAFGREVYWYTQVTSTNDLAARLADRPVAEGALVIADTQTAGRGRQGRQWCSPRGSGLYASVVLRPHPRVLPLLTIAAGVALAEGIHAATGFSAALKWPNDLVVPGAPGAGPAKLAGVLVEAFSSGGAAAHACVLGFGVNIRPAAYPPDVERRATSLERELGRSVDAGPLLVECLAALAARYHDLHEQRSDLVIAAWRTHAQPLLGATVEWETRDGAQSGTAEDVDASGALLIRTRTGVARVTSGEVRWT